MLPYSFIIVKGRPPDVNEFLQEKQRKERGWQRRGNRDIIKLEEKEYISII